VGSFRARVTIGRSLVVISVGLSSGCFNRPETVLERLTEANRLAAALEVQFTKAGDAANRAVMADTDETSVTFAHEAEQATQAVQREADTLRPILEELRYSQEAGLLEEFGRRFAEYRSLDGSILELAVENTNLKAQRLSFGPAQEAADAIRDSLDGVTAFAPAPVSLRVQALVATAIAAVREIQVLQAPHIAESDDVAMSRLEKRMATSEAGARRALETLASLISPASRSQFASATAALDRFMGLNAQIITLSRRNSNVRSLALSLGQKRTLTAACADSLRALRDALAKRGFSATR
jgi:hypothetical protein